MSPLPVPLPVPGPMSATTIIVDGPVAVVRYAGPVAVAPCGMDRENVDGPVAVLPNAGPVAVTPVGLLAIRGMGLWPSSAVVAALQLLESKCLWMMTRVQQCPKG